MPKIRHGVATLALLLEPNGSSTSRGELDVLLRVGVRVGAGPLGDPSRQPRLGL